MGCLRWRYCGVWLRDWFGIAIQVQVVDSVESGGFVGAKNQLVTAYLASWHLRGLVAGKSSQNHNKIITLGAEDAQTILLERTARPFTNLDDLYHRTRVAQDVLHALAASGALECFGTRRDVLWRLGELEQAYRGSGKQRPLLELSEDFPDLAWLSPLELATWDASTTGVNTGAHVMAFHRAWLDQAGVQLIGAMVEARATVAGVVIAFQKPPTAQGFVFITLEDESGQVFGNHPTEGLSDF